MVLGPPGLFSLVGGPLRPLPGACLLSSSSSPLAGFVVVVVVVGSFRYRVLESVGSGLIFPCILGCSRKFVDLSIPRSSLLLKYGLAGSPVVPGL